MKKKKKAERFPRYCSECEKGMFEGFCVDSGCLYYCSEKCLHKNFSPEQWDKMYQNGEGDSYWTDWYDIEKEDWDERPQSKSNHEREALQ